MLGSLNRVTSHLGVRWTVENHRKWDCLTDAAVNLRAGWWRHPCSSRDDGTKERPTQRRVLRECILQEAKLGRNAFRITQTKEILHTRHCSHISNERLFFRPWENGCRWESGIQGWTQWKCRAVGPMEVHITAHNFNNLCRSLGQQRMVRMPYKWAQNCHSSLWAKGNGSCKWPHEEG